MKFTVRPLRCMAFLVAFHVAIGCTGYSKAEAPQSRLLPTKPENAIRIATYNVSLNRRKPGELARDLASDHQQARAVAAVIRLVQPDVLLLNEVDFAVDSDNATTFATKFLADTSVDALGSEPWTMPHVYSGPVNTGIPSGLDLNSNGSSKDPEDAWGFGFFPGQYGMAVLSRFPFSGDVTSLQKFRWAELPAAKIPATEGEPYYSEETWRQLRLSSKSFWDVPIETTFGELHLLASHPTPPAFDGPEDRNGCRNHDEIKLIQYYIEAADFLRDDQGQKTGLDAGDMFVVVGDLNSDPKDGGSQPGAIVELLEHPRVAQYAAPTSQGALQAAQSQAGANEKHQGAPEQDTGDFNDRSVGNLRIDYVLPSKQFQVVQSGVFWPALDAVPASQREAIKECLAASDHHLVWVDVVLKK